MTNKDKDELVKKILRENLIPWKTDDEFISLKNAMLYFHDEYSAALENERKNIYTTSFMVLSFVDWIRKQPDYVDYKSISRHEKSFGIKGLQINLDRPNGVFITDADFRKFNLEGLAEYLGVDIKKLKYVQGKSNTKNGVLTIDFNIHHNGN